MPLLPLGAYDARSLPVKRHLPGKHNQQNHAGGSSTKVGAHPATRKELDDAVERLQREDPEKYWMVAKTHDGAKPFALYADDGSRKGFFALYEHDGGSTVEIGTVVSLPGSRGVVADTMKATDEMYPDAKQKLDCFDGHLPKIYGKHGFVETDRIQWDDQYAPDAWKPEYGRPDVVFMERPPAKDRRSLRHLPGKHNQQSHAGGKGGGDMARGIDRTEWIADETRDGYAKNPFFKENDFKDPRDHDLMYIGKKQGYDGKPTVGSIEDTVAAGGVEIFRGSAKETNAKLVDGPYEPGTGLYGNGYYFSNKQRVAEHFAKLDINGSLLKDTVARRADGTVVRAALKPGAKVVDYDDLKGQMTAWKAEAAPKTQGLGDLYKSDFKTPDDLYSPHMVDTVMADPGRFAAAKGYDAIKVVGQQDGTPAMDGEPFARQPGRRKKWSANDQYVILNRTALVVEAEQPKSSNLLKLKDANGNVLSEVDITGMEA